MPLSRRDLLRASVAAAAALTAGCSSGGAVRASRTVSSPASGTPATRTPSTSAARSTAAAAPPAPSDPARQVDHGPRTRQQVALTFHGAGDAALARQLLRLLATRQVHATVMAVGTWLREEPQMAGAILGAGHDLGNHTLHHYPMRTLSAASTLSEIRGCATTLHRQTGSQGTWFRASGTQATTATIRRAAGRAGYDRCISYDVDGLDWQDPSTATVVRAVLDGSRGGSIISLHLGHPVTVAALPAILDGLDAAGLAPVTLSKLLA